MAHPRFPEQSASAPNVSADAPFPRYRLDGCAVVVASGEIDLSTSPGLREALDRAAHSSDRIIVDITGVTFLDSTGLGVLVRAVNQNHHGQEGTLCLVGPVPLVRNVLDITHLSEVFPIYASVAEAVERMT